MEYNPNKIKHRLVAHCYIQNGKAYYENYEHYYRKKENN